MRSPSQWTGLSRASIHHIWRAFSLGPASFPELQVIATWSNVGSRLSPTNNSAAASIAPQRNSKAAIRTFIQQHNRDPKPFVWHKTADRILDSVARFSTRTLETGH
jgi:hypothetical protein